MILQQNFTVKCTKVGTKPAKHHNYAIKLFGHMIRKEVTPEPMRFAVITMNEYPKIDLYPKASLIPFPDTVGSDTFIVPIKN